MVMVANPEPIKRISTCYPPPASSTQSVSDLWWELLLPIKDVDWQLLSIQRFPENAIAPNPSPASCHKGLEVGVPSDLPSDQLRARLRLASVTMNQLSSGGVSRRIYISGPCGWSGSGVAGTACPAGWWPSARGWPDVSSSWTKTRELRHCSESSEASWTLRLHLYKNEMRKELFPWPRGKCQNFSSSQIAAVHRALQTQFLVQSVSWAVVWGCSTVLSWEDQLLCSGLQWGQADKAPRDTSAQVGRM